MLHAFPAAESRFSWAAFPAEYVLTPRRKERQGFSPKNPFIVFLKGTGDVGSNATCHSGARSLFLTIWSPSMSFDS
jgi:hypothetical protein